MARSFAHTKMRRGKGGQSNALGRSRGGFSTKLHAVDTKGRLIYIATTPGQLAGDNAGGKDEAWLGGTNTTRACAIAGILDQSSGSASQRAHGYMLRGTAEHSRRDGPPPLAKPCSTASSIASPLGGRRVCGRAAHARQHGRTIPQRARQSTPCSRNTFSSSPVMYPKILGHSSATRSR
jgi:hypothetical protein